MFKVIVAGGRDFDNYELLEKEMDFLLQNKTNVEIVSGTARGTDTLGERYAKSRGHRLIRFPADWDRFGLSAGYKRNEIMGHDADALVAFWDKTSKGTKHMIDIANRLGLEARIVRY